MPACVDCRKFDRSSNECSVSEGSAVRKCTMAMLEQELSALQGKRVLEIGCGSWAYPRNLILNAGNQWYGIDPNLDQSIPPKTTQKPKDLEPSKGRRIRATAGRLPFADNSFDVVFSTNSLEHWREFGEPYTRGFREMHRVLRPGGLLIKDFPIHLHGHNRFVLGRIRDILRLWSDVLWKDLRYEEWRKEYHPLEAYQGWRRSGIPDSKMPNGGAVSTYMMSVVAVARDAGDVSFAQSARYCVCSIVESAYVAALAIPRRVLVTVYRESGLRKVRRLLARGSA